MVGRRWTNFIAVVTTAAIFAACFAPVASAEGDDETGGFGAFRLKGTNGYSILGMALSKPHFKHGEMIVWARKRDASVMYLAPAIVTATTIDAGFGAEGKISVDFQAVGPPKRVHSECAGGGTTTFQPGNWVGTIELAGEEGFTRVQETRTKAVVNPFIELTCGTFSISEVSGHGVRGARLVARSATGKHALFLQVNKNQRNASVRVESSLEERRGDLVVDRDVVDHFSARSFRFNPLLRSATLTPPAPFSGSAKFSRNAKPVHQWTGDLSVDFPGRADVPLAGRRFHAALVHAQRTEEETHSARRR